MTSRRTFHRILGSMLGAGTFGVRAQPANRAYRVGLSHIPRMLRRNISQLPSAAD